MQKIKITILLVIFFSLILPNSVIMAAETKLFTGQEYPVTNEIIVKYQNQKHLKKITLPQTVNAQQMVKSYQQLAGVELATVNHYFYAQKTPNDPFYSSQNYLQLVAAPQAWDLTTGSSQVIIAVLDTGLDMDHPDLAAVIWHNQDEIASDGIDNDNNGFIDDLSGWDFINQVPDPNPKFDSGYNETGINHGTAVTGVAAAIGDNQEGIAGLTWKTTIMPLRVLDHRGVGDTQTITEAIYYAVDNGADIINLSFVGPASDEILEEALTYAYQHNVVIIVSAGNGDANGQGFNLNQQPLYPICSDSQERQILGVGAVDESGIKTVFSNYGSNCLDLFAPGEGIMTTIVHQPDQDYNEYYQSGWQGTSMAVPIVSGAVALIKAYQPELSNQEIIARLKDYSYNLDSLNPQYVGDLGAGLLNIHQSLIQAQEESDNQLLHLNQIVTAPGNQGAAHIRVFNARGEEIGLRNFFAWPETWRGGYSLATGDVNADGSEDIIVAAPAGQEPKVAAYNRRGEKLLEFLAYQPDFKGGLYLATGDLDNDNQIEIITGAGQGGGPQVRIFDNRGQPKFIPGFFAYQTNFRGGVKVATGDLNGDGQLEIITGTGTGGGPHIRFFNHYGQAVINQGFFAYNPNFRGGVNVTTGDLNNDGRAEIITGAGQGGGPQVRIFNSSGEAQFTPGFFAYATNFQGGVNVATGDLNGDDQLEIITGAGFPGGSQIRFFNRYGQATLNSGFFAYPQIYRLGVNLAVIR